MTVSMCFPAFDLEGAMPEMRDRHHVLTLLHSASWSANMTISCERSAPALHFTFDFRLFSPLYQLLHFS
jgi:hypothetical protein